MTEIVWVTLGRAPETYHDVPDCTRGHPSTRRIPTIGAYARAAGLRRCSGCEDRAERIMLGVETRRST